MRPAISILRLFLGFICPIMIGGYLIMFLTGLLNNRQSTFFELVWIPLFGIPFYFIVFPAFIIQSIIYTVLMEFVINPKVPSHKLCLLISTLLGVVAAILPTLIMKGCDNKFDDLMYFIFSGAGTGLILGSLLRYLYNKSLKRLD